MIVVAERAGRPGGREPTASRAARRAFDPTCPFCPGNEEQTPPEILRRPTTGAWEVRVVPNKYPALVPELSADREPAGELHIHAPAKGHYEVIVEGPVHEPPPGGDVNTLLEVFLAAQERYRAFRDEPKLELFSLFKNYGRAAGASLAHPHWQLAAAPVVPRRLQQMLDTARQYRSEHGRSVYHDLVREELDVGSRVVRSGEPFVVLAPYAPQWSGETWIMPRVGGSHFGDTARDDLIEFAELLSDTVARLARVFDEPDYNVVIYTAPLGAAPIGFFSWHARIQPRMTVQGGFELGTGTAIAVIAPERTAELLRSAADERLPLPVSRPSQDSQEERQQEKLK